MLKPVKKNLKLIAEIESQGLKKQWIAKKAGIDPSTLSRIISGVFNPTSIQASRIAEIIGVHVDDIF